MTPQEIIDNFELKVKPFFKGLTFEASRHEYFYRGNKIAKSVSGLIHEFVKPQDWDKIAERKDIKEGKPLGYHKQLWAKVSKDACDDGSDVHDFGEKSRKLEEAKEHNKKKAIVNFWSDCFSKYPGRYVVVARELKMVHKKFLFSGTGDFILFDTWTNTFIIGDYKTNKDLFKNFRGQKLLAPFSRLLDNPYNHYQIQFSLYQVLLEQIYGFKVSERWLIHLKPDATYDRFLTEDYSGILKVALENRLAKQQLKRAS